MNSLQVAFVVSCFGYVGVIGLVLRLTRRGDPTDAWMVLAVLVLGTVSLALRLPVFIFGGTS